MRCIEQITFVKLNGRAGDLLDTFQGNRTIAAVIHRIGKIVQCNDIVTSLLQCDHTMRPDITSAAGHQHSFSNVIRHRCVTHSWNCSTVTRLTTTNSSSRSSGSQRHQKSQNRICNRLHGHFHWHFHSHSIQCGMMIATTNSQRIEGKKKANNKRND